MRGKHDRDEAGRGVPRQSPSAPGQGRAHAARGRRAEARLLGALAALPPSPARITGAGRAAPGTQEAQRVPGRRTRGRGGGALGQWVAQPSGAVLDRAATPPESHRELSLQLLRPCRGSGHTELRAAPPGGAGSPRSRVGAVLRAPHDLPPHPPARRRLPRGPCSVGTSAPWY